MDPTTIQGLLADTNFWGAVLAGAFVWFSIRCVLTGFFTLDQNERAVKLSFGRAERLGAAMIASLPLAESLNDDEKLRYSYPQLRVIGPGGPYFKWPWQTVRKVSVATATVSMAQDPENSQANQAGTILEAVTKDQLNTGLSGDLRYRVAEQNLYAYLFGVKRPIAHVMGYFVSVLRERIANFEAPTTGSKSDGTVMSEVQGISINDLRKNLRDLNEHMDRECGSSAARYGMVLDASLITGIEPPEDVESALAAINTAHNEVSSSVSLAQAGADQRIVQSRRAVEIATLRAQAEAQPLIALAAQLSTLKKAGPEALAAYRRFVRLDLLGRAGKAIREVRQ